MYQPTHIVTSAEEIRHTLGEVSGNQRDKVIDHVDTHISAWIQRSPFVVISTLDRAGRISISDYTLLRR